MPVKRHELQPVAGPELAQAASLAMAILRHTRTCTWLQLAQAVRAPILEVLTKLDELVLTADQQQLLSSYAQQLSMLHCSTKVRGATCAHDRPTVMLAVCPECGAWFPTDGRLPTRCPVGWQCTGTPMKASAAKKVEAVIPERTRPGSEVEQGS